MTSPPTASADSVYGSDLEWDDAAEAQLAALELATANFSPSPSSNNATNSTATPRIEVDGVGVDGEADEEGDTVTAARLAEALREFGVVGSPDQPDERSLWERYRQRRGWGALSVSDLSGPSWCEVRRSSILSSFFAS
jgi:exonuclease V